MDEFISILKSNPQLFDNFKQKLGQWRLNHQTHTSRTGGGENGAWKRDANSYASRKAEAFAIIQRGRRLY
jgi:hypothetical protein